MKINQIQRNTLFVLLVLLNFLVKAWYVTSNSIGGDEPFSVFHAQLNVNQIISELSQGNNPPLYEILLHFWIKLFGISEMAVRFPSLLFSCVSLFFIFRLGTRFLSDKIAIYSSLIFIFSTYQIGFAHEARVYAFMGMLTVISMYFYLILLTERKTRNLLALILFLLANILLIYAHYFGFFVLFIQFLFVILNKKLRQENWKYALGLSAILFLLYLPNVFVVLNRFLNSSSNGTWIESPSGIADLYNMIRVFTNAPVLAGIVIIVLLIALVKYFIPLKKQKVRSIPVQLITSWFVFPFFFMFFISFWIPMFIDRYLMFVSIAFCFLIAIAADSLIENKKFNFIIPSIICLLFVVTSKPNVSNKRSVKEVVQKIKTLQDEKTLVLICPYDFLLNFAYYNDLEQFKQSNTKQPFYTLDTTLRKRNCVGVNHLGDVDFNKWNRVIYLDAGANFSLPNNENLNTLHSNYTLKSTTFFPEIFHIYEFEK